MTGEVSEVPTAPRVEAQMLHGPEQTTLKPAEAVSKTADNLQEELNRGVEPETLMKGFVEGIYDWVDGENNDAKKEGGGDKKPEEKLEQSDEQSQTVARTEQDQPKETPEQQFQKAVQEHREKYGLPADNLESDPRNDQIKNQLMADWFQRNPEPGQGKEKLTDREKDQWRDWVNKKLAFQDALNQKATEIFRTQFGEDFDKYQKYGVYQSLEEDPRFQSLLEAQRRRFTKIAERSGNAQAINQAEAEAKNLFAKLYPEITRLYAIKDSNLTELIKQIISKETYQQPPQENQNTQGKENFEQTSEIDPYKVEIKTDKLIEFITGLPPSPENLPKILEIFEEDQKIVRSKYGLPPLEMLRNNPREYERRLRNIAESLGITILPKISCGDFFDEAAASGVFMSGIEGGSKKIGVDINEESLEKYIRSLLTLDHEIIHACQDARYESMPIERQEYEAYIASVNIKYLKENPEAIKDIFFDFFIGTSVRIFYRFSNEDAKKRGLPPIKPSY